MYTVLMYHSIGAPDEDSYDVSVASFERQMRTIADSNLTSLSIADAVSSKNSDGVVVSFDDGHSTVLSNALPILQKYHIKSTIYVTSGYIGSGDRWLSWPQLALLAEGGVDLQAHGHTHRFLNALDDAELADELHRPRELFSKHMDIDVRHFALPGGRGNSNVIEQAASEGYRSVATSRPGLWHGPGDPGGLDQIDRYCVASATTDDEFRLMVEQDRFFATRKRAAFATKRLVKGLVGDRLYQALWMLRNKGKSA